MADPTKVKLIGKEVTKRVLGIPAIVEDINKKKLSLKKYSEDVDWDDRADLSKKELLDYNQFIVTINPDFSETTVEYTFFTPMDIVGLLGGLWASFNSLLAQLGFVSIVLYVYNLASMIRRKDE